MLRLLALAVTMAVAHGGHHPHQHWWTVCDLRVDGSFPKTCDHYLLPKDYGKRQYGHWHKCSWENRGYWRCVTYPTFTPPPKPTPPPTLWSESVYVTGYSYTPACGDWNGQTADGSPLVPYYTMASWDSRLWHHHIRIPSLGITGFVDDTGAALDVFMPSCGATYGITGPRVIDVLP